MKIIKSCLSCLVVFLSFALLLIGCGDDDTKKVHPPVGEFILASPEKNALNVPVKPTLTWTDAENVKSYSLFVAKTENFDDPQAFTDLTGTSYTITGDLEYNTKYFWMVHAHGEGANNIRFSAISAFTTEEEPFPFERKGLYMEKGILKHDGKEYATIGVNYYGAFCHSLGGGKENFDRMFAMLAGYGIEYCRLNMGLYSADEYVWMEKNKQAYWARMDEVVRSAEQNNIGLICSLFWNWGSSIAECLGEEPISAMSDPNSKTRKYMTEYTQTFVNRYMESPAIWVYEFGNEINLGCDVPHEPNGMKTAIAQPMLVDFATLVKATDKYGRLVTSGCSQPRPSQYHQTKFGNWTADTREQMAETMGWHNPKPIDCVSVHVYDMCGDAFLPGNQNNWFNLIKVYKEEAAKQGKALFIGEFHGYDSRCMDIVDAIVANRVPISGVWMVGEVAPGSITADPVWQDKVLKYIRAANLKLKN